MIDVNPNIMENIAEFASEVTENNTADYLIFTALLAEYLEEGLSLHSYSTER